MGMTTSVKIEININDSREYKFLQKRMSCCQSPAQLKRMQKFKIDAKKWILPSSFYLGTLFESDCVLFFF